MEDYIAVKQMCKCTKNFVRMENSHIIVRVYFHKNLWKSALQQKHFSINTGKTKVKITGKENMKVSVHVINKELEQVESFKYLQAKTVWKHKQCQNNTTI